MNQRYMCQPLDVTYTQTQPLQYNSYIIIECLFCRIENSFLYNSRIFLLNPILYITYVTKLKQLHVDCCIATTC